MHKILIQRQVQSILSIEIEMKRSSNNGSSANLLPRRRKGFRETSEDYEQTFKYY